MSNPTAEGPENNNVKSTENKAHCSCQLNKERNFIMKTQHIGTDHADASLTIKQVARISDLMHYEVDEAVKRNLLVPPVPGSNPPVWTLTSIHEWFLAHEPVMPTRKRCITTDDWVTRGLYALAQWAKSAAAQDNWLRKESWNALWQADKDCLGAIYQMTDALNDLLEACDAAREGEAACGISPKVSPCERVAADNLNLQRLLEDLASKLEEEEFEAHCEQGGHQNE